MPELPEVEVLVRHLRPALRGRVIRGVTIGREKVIAPTPRARLLRELKGARFEEIRRRGKFLVFELKAAAGKRFPLIGHLGMTGRMYVQPTSSRLPRHLGVALDLGDRTFVYEDTRYFGRLTLDTRAIDKLGPEPLAAEFRAGDLARALANSRQAIKVKLLDQSAVAGVGNIYASEALFRARISPRRAANCLPPDEVRRLWRAVRAVLRQAIRFGSTVPLDWSGRGDDDGMFYYGSGEGASNYYEERLLVYDRAGKPCCRCGRPIRRIVQVARSTYYCPGCQAG